MNIISAYFLGFSIASAFLFYLINVNYRNLYLTLVSAFFIATLSVNLLFYILFFVAVNFFIGLSLPSSKNRNILFRLGISFNLLQLIVLRYADFTVNPLLDIFNINYDASAISRFIIPVGISYFTLQAIGYLISLKKGWEKPENNFIRFLLYIIFYPKFLSGPVERSNHFLPQIKQKKEYVYGNIIVGLKIALWGFFKKVVIANQFGFFVQNAYANTDTISSGYAWVVLFVQAVYLYFDFSGYTDIAIGFAKMYGIDLLPNFRRPFLARNITGFWKRFHISLSSWFGDYIFKQVMFKRRKWGTFASVYALFLTWVLFGIWHGAGWNFMALGLVLATAIMYEFFTRKQRMIIFSKLPEKIRVWVSRLFTFTFYAWALSFFFSPDLGTTFVFFGKLFSFTGAEITGVPVIPMLFGLSVAFWFLLFEVLEEDFETYYKIIIGYWNRNIIVRVVVYYAMSMLILSEMNGNSSFIYEMF